MSEEDIEVDLMEIEYTKEDQAQRLQPAMDQIIENPSGLKNTLHGVTYQQAFINTIAVTAYSHVQNGSLSDLTIISEDESFAKFDDLVLKLPDSILCHQLKHKQEPVTYSVRDLTKATGEKINLADYFTPYRNIKEKFGDKKLSFIFFFNSGFDKDLEDCTELLNCRPEDDLIFGSFTGETRKFSFSKSNEETKEEITKTEKKIRKALVPIVTMDIKRRKGGVEIQLPDINNNDDLDKFINKFSKILEGFSLNSENTLDLSTSSHFRDEYKPYKPLFLSILDLEANAIEIEEKLMQKSEQGKETRERGSISLNFTESFISNENLTGIANKIRSQLKYKDGEEVLKTVLKSISVKCPKNLFELETVSKPKNESPSQKKLLISPAAENNKSKITCIFESLKDQFLLLSLFRSDKESGPFIFEQNEYGSNLKTRIYQKFCKIFTQCLSKESKESVKRLSKESKKSGQEREEEDGNDDSVNDEALDQECSDLIDEFLGDLIFKIKQPSYEKLLELSYEKIQGLTKLMAGEIHESIFAMMNEWLASTKTQKSMIEYDKQFQKIKANLERVELLSDTLPFIRDCEKKQLILNFSTLVSENPLKNFINDVNADSDVFLLSEEAVGRSRLDVYQAISKIKRIQKDKWAFIDIRVDHFQSLKDYIQSQDLQFFVIEIPIVLSGAKFELLKEFLEEFLKKESIKKKKVILLNTHADRNTRDGNLNIIREKISVKFIQEISKRLSFQQIEDACENPLEKYILIGDKYFSLQDILADTDCGLYHALSHPRYLCKILKECTSLKERKPDRMPFYIKHQIVREFPVYKLETVLKQANARIIWFQNLPDELNNLEKIEELLPPDEPSLEEHERPQKILLSCVEEISSLEDYQKLLEKNQKTVALKIEDEVLKKKQNEMLVIYYQNYDLEQGHLVESDRQNGFMKSIKPIHFSQISNIYGVQEVCLSEILKPSSENSSEVINWIQGNAGMGKSYLADEIERQWKTLSIKDSYKWFFKLDLTKIVYSEIKENTKLEDFLITTISEKGFWRHAALQNDIQSPGGVLLLLDAWDELKSDMNEDVKKLFAMIPLTVSVVILSRPYGTNSIAFDNWGNNYLTLRPFNEKEIQEYVERFFESEDLQRFSKDEWKQLGKKIVEWKNEFGNPFSQIMGVPLQIFQLCQTLLPKIKHLDENEEGFEIDLSTWFYNNRPVDIASLYEQFIFTGFQKFSQFASQDIGIFYDCWEKHLNFLSIQAYQQLFGKTDKYILKYHKQDLLLSIESKKLLLKTGLIKSIDIEKGEVEFVHQTYKEYFGAFYILRAFFGKEQSRVYKKILGDIKKNKFFKYYRIVFVFAFQICLTPHPIFSSSSPADDQKLMVNELWESLSNTNPRDVVGIASLELFAACLHPLTEKQRKDLLDLLPNKYHQEITYIFKKAESFLKELPSQKRIKVPAEKSQEETKNNLTNVEIISSLQNSDKVVEFTRNFIQKYPRDKRILAECFKQVFGKNFQGERNRYWDINGGFHAMSMLGDYFDKEHAAYFKYRIKDDPSWRVWPAVEALSYLFGMCSKRETLDHLTSILLVICEKSRTNFPYILEQILENIDPLLLMESILKINMMWQEADITHLIIAPPLLKIQDLLNNIKFFPVKICDTVKLFLSIAYLAKYSVVVVDEELYVITGEKYVSMLKDSRCEEFKRIISELIEGYSPLEHTHTYFIEKKLGSQMIQGRSYKISEEILKGLENCFSIQSCVAGEIEFLRNQDLLSPNWAEELRKAAAKHWADNDHWALKGGLEAICNVGKYFDGIFCTFLILRALCWNNNLFTVKSHLSVLEEDIKIAKKKKSNDPEVIFAQKWLKVLRDFLKYPGKYSKKFEKWKQQKGVTFEKIVGSFESEFGRSSDP